MMMVSYTILLLQSIASFDMYFFLVVAFGFDPASYSDEETVSTQVLTVTHMSGGLGEFRFRLTAATDDSSAIATATGNDLII